MKKHIVLPSGICLALIVLSGLYIYSKYLEQVETRKELITSYAAQTKAQLEVIKSHVGELAYIVKPFISEIDMKNANVVSEKYADNISLLKQFYIDNVYFIRGIAAYNTSGDVFNLYYYNNESFIIDFYELIEYTPIRNNAIVFRLRKAP